MFTNIGSKIKGLAIALTVLGIISSIVYGVSVISSASELYGAAKTGGIIGGLLIVVLGSVLSWIGSLALYGFGQLVDSAQNIEKKLTGTTDEYYSSQPQKVDSDYLNLNNGGRVNTAADYGSNNVQSNDNGEFQRVGVFVTRQDNDGSNRPNTELFIRDGLLYCKSCGTVVEPGDSICSGCKKRIDWTTVN